MSKPPSQEWAIAEIIAAKIKHARGDESVKEAFQQKYPDINLHNDVIFLTPGRTIQGETQTVKVGIEGLHSTFMLVGDNLCQLGPTLGQGAYGRVISAYTEEGTHLAIKITTERQYDPKETAALKKIARLHPLSDIKIGDIHYTFMLAVPGSNLNKLMSKIRYPNPWKTAANHLNLTTQLETLGKVIPLRKLLDTPLPSEILQLGILDEEQLNALVDEYSALSLSFTNVWPEAAKQLDEEADGGPVFFRKYQQVSAQHIDLNTKAGREEALDEDLPIFTEQELYTLIKKKDALLAEYGLTETERYQLAIQAAGDLDHVFKHRLLHRDIKGANFVGCILGSSDDTDSPPAMVQLVDFGGALSFAETHKAKFYMGTPGYVAPEVSTSIDRREQRHLAKKDRRQDVYTVTEAYFSTASDTYSFAQTCLQDFGLSHDAGFGILSECLSEAPHNRPDIVVLQSALSVELSMKEKRAIPIEDAHILRAHLRSKLSKYKGEFLDAYETQKAHEKSRFSLKGPKKFGIKREMSMSDILAHAQGGGKRSRAILQDQGLMDGKTLSDDIQTLLTLETTLSEITSTTEPHTYREAKS